MKQERLLIDTDMGNDDIMAISMLLGSVCFDVVGYTLTDGVSKTLAATRNLMALLNFFQKTAPVAVGPQRKYQTAIDFPSIDIERAESLTLLNGLNITPQSPTLDRFEDLIGKSLSEPLTLVALGPLTNVASIIENYSKSEKNIRKILVMGGGVLKGNVFPDYLAEYNIALDPLSANTVFNSDIPITMVGIDATKSVPATVDFSNRIKVLEPNSPFGQVTQKIIVNNDKDFNEFYDPLAVSLLIDPKIAQESKKGYVTVSLQGKSTGQTLLSEDLNGNTQVIFSANSERFYRLVASLTGNTKKGGDKNDRN